LSINGMRHEIADVMFQAHMQLTELEWPYCGCVPWLCLCTISVVACHFCSCMPLPWLCATTVWELGTSIVSYDWCLFGTKPVTNCQTLQDAHGWRCTPRLCQARCLPSTRQGRLRRRVLWCRYPLLPWTYIAKLVTNWYCCACREWHTTTHTEVSIDTPPFVEKQLYSFSVSGKCCLTTWNSFVWLMVPFAWAILITYLQMLIASDVHIETSTTFEFSQSQLGSTATSAKTSYSCAHSKDSCPQTSTEFVFASSTLTASYQHILHSTAASKCTSISKSCHHHEGLVCKGSAAALAARKRSCQADAAKQEGWR